MILRVCHLAYVFLCIYLELCALALSLKVLHNKYATPGAQSILINLLALIMSGRSVACCKGWNPMAEHCGRQALNPFLGAGGIIGSTT